MAELENLLLEGNSHKEQLYCEMEILDGTNVETRNGFGCMEISGSKRYIIAAAVASIGGVLFGYDLGIVSGANLQLKDDFHLDCQKQEMVVSSMLIGALFGSLIGGYIIDFLGRRKTIILNSLIFFAGAALLAFAPSYAILIVGRLIVGFATSLSAIAECIYIAEIAPPKRRGLLVSLNEIGIVSGLLFSYLVNFMFINTHNGWRYMFGISGIPALLQGFGVIFLPPSPRWLVCQGQDAKALQILKLLNHGPEPEQEISKIKDSVNQERNYNVCYLFGRKENMRGRMFVGLGVVFFQQFTGQPSILYYAPSIFKNIGFRSHSEATLATAGIGLSKLIATIITLTMVDKAGRRRFLIFGSIVMTISVAVLYTATISFPSPYKGICQNNDTNPMKTINSTLAPRSFIKNSGQTSSMYTSPALQFSHTTFPPRHLGSQTANSSVKNVSATSYAYFYGNLSTTLSSSSQYNGSRRQFLSLKAMNNSRAYVNQTHSEKSEMPSFVKYIVFISLVAFSAGYSSSYGPVTWLVLSEIYPTPIKGRAFAATTVLNWSSNLVVSWTLLDLIDSIGVSWTFFLYGFLGFLAILFIKKYVPETKNRSLEEINALFSTRNSATSDGRCPSTGCCGFFERYNTLTSANISNISLNSEDWNANP